MTKQFNPSWTLFALAISAFAIGSTEFISVGLMPLLVSSSVSYTHLTLPTNREV